MASFSKKIDNKYDVTTYDGTKNTCKWIVEELTGLYGNDCNVEYDFLFELGSVTCSCGSLEEFTEIAYGNQDYNMINILITFKLINDNKLIFVHLSKDSISISSDDKNTLESIILRIERSKVEHDTPPNHITNIEHQYINNGDIIKGKNNTIIKGQNTIVNPPTTKGSKFGKWIGGVLQGITINLLWKLLGIAALIAVAYIVMKWS